MPQLPRRAALSLTALAATSVLGCGGADRVPTPETTEDQEIVLEWELNRCPELTSLVIVPRTTGMGGPVSLQAHGADPEGSVSYAWSAKAGSFTSETGNRTTYFCGEQGPQNLLLLLSDDDGCQIPALIVVECLD